MIALASAFKASAFNPGILTESSGVMSLLIITNASGLALYSFLKSRLSFYGGTVFRRYKNFDSDYFGELYYPWIGHACQEKTLRENGQQSIYYIHYM